MKISAGILSLSLGLGVLSLVSCDSSHKPVQNTPKTALSHISLPGSEWVLTDLAGVPALSNVKATLAFPEAGRVAGNASCNRFTGTVAVADDSIKFGPLASTRMACADNAVSAQEDNYLMALGAATRYAYRDPYLLIYADGFAKPLRFTRTPSGAP
jgi:heat shock protein HslJ